MIPVIGRLAALRCALQLWLDDERGMCRLCRQGKIEAPRVEHVLVYTGVVLHGRYHEDCAMAAREARYIARHTVTR